MRPYHAHPLLLLACVVPALAGEREPAAWDNFNAPILSLRPARPVGPSVSAEPSPTTTTRRLTTPSLTLEPPASAATTSGMDSGFFSGAETTRWRVSQTLERRAESLRQEWTDLDARRAEEHRSREGIWNQTFLTLFPEPEVFRFGNHEIGGGLPTAIHRRNPLALFNQVFFSLSF